jgi:hypothetical protein
MHEPVPIMIKMRCTARWAGPESKSAHTPGRRDVRDHGKPRPRRLDPDHPEQLDHLLAGADATLDDEVLDRIDEIVLPGTDAGPNDVAYTHRRPSRT